MSNTLGFQLVMGDAISVSQINKMLQDLAVKDKLRKRARKMERRAKRNRRLIREMEKQRPPATMSASDDDGMPGDTCSSPDPDTASEQARLYDMEYIMELYWQCPVKTQEQ